MLRSLICILQENPQHGLKGTIGSLAAGTTPTIIQFPREDIIFWFQVIAFTVTITAGIMTIIASRQKNKKKRCEDEN